MFDGTNHSNFNNQCSIHDLHGKPIHCLAIINITSFELSRIWYLHYLLITIHLRWLRRWIPVYQQSSIEAWLPSLQFPCTFSRSQRFSKFSLELSENGGWFTRSLKFRIQSLRRTQVQLQMAKLIRRNSAGFCATRTKRPLRAAKFEGPPNFACTFLKVF